MTTLFIDAFGGLAGDMFLAALLDLGDPRFTLADLRELAETLVPGECSIELARTQRGGIAGAHLSVRTHESEHPPHRHYADLERLLAAAPLPESARARALAALWRIAVAEGAVHGLDPREVHFHEVGAVDTLVDVCGAALALERLGVTRVLATPPITGEGTVRCAHGVMPVPTPAVVEILRDRELLRAGGPGERLTPTAAAMLREWVEVFEAPGGFVAAAVGYGAGTRDPEHGPPNLVRVELGEPGPGAAAQAEAWLVEVNLDDVTGEELGHCVAGLREAGALEVWSVPVQMKKDRPGVVVSALCRAGDRRALEAVLFERTPTLGLRWSRRERTECERETIVVELYGAPVRVKRRLRPDYPGASPAGERDLSPEYDDLVRLARERGASLRELERSAIAAALQTLGEAAGGTRPSRS